MLWDAIKEYTKVVRNIMNIKWLYIALLTVLHIIATSLLTDRVLIFIWLLIWLITVPPFAGWYLAAYKPKKKDDKQEM